MIVYRVENENGYGPYNVYATTPELAAAIDEMMLEGWDDGDYPVPGHDGIRVPVDYRTGRHEHGWHCGFTSMHQARAWFWSNRVCTQLEENGFHFYSFDVPDDHVRIGLHQCEFKRIAATRLKVEQWQKETA